LALVARHILQGASYEKHYHGRWSDGKSSQEPIDHIETVKQKQLVEPVLILRVMSSTIGGCMLAIALNNFYL
jgi:hypothetical protein